MRTLPGWGLPAVCVIALGWMGASSRMATAQVPTVTVPQLPIAPPSVLPTSAPNQLPVRVTEPVAPVAPAQFTPIVQAIPPASADDRIQSLEAQNRELQQKLDEVYRRLGMGGSSHRVPAPSAPSSRPNLGSTSNAPVSPDTTFQSTGAYGRRTNIASLFGEEHEGAVKLDMSEGVRMSTADGRYKFEFHDLSQFDGRFFNKTGDALHDNFVIPRQRFYFTGTADKYFEYQAVLNRGYGSLDVLDSYVNFKFDPAFTVRVGRTKTPFGYEYYKIAEGDLIGPERSVFVGNLSPNRQLGVMAYGKVWDQRFDYAAGIFNGPQRSFQDFNNYKTMFLYADVQPFMLGDIDLVRHLHFVGAADYGRENDPLEPNAFHTANDETTTPAADNVSPTFLQFNKNATVTGEKAFWSGELVWYYRSATSLLRYDNGFITYALPVGQTMQSTRVPYQGFSLAATYFVTGEEIVRRKDLHPLRNFNIQAPLTNPGAVEPYFRFSYLNAGSQIFTSGLVDAKLWSRTAVVTDLGVNWYLNPFIQVRFDWQHSQFNTPVQLSSSRTTSEIDLFWIRTQLFY